MTRNHTVQLPKPSPLHSIVVRWGLGRVSGVDGVGEGREAGEGHAGFGGWIP